MTTVSWALVAAGLTAYIVFNVLNRKLARTAMELAHVRRSRDRLLKTVVNIHAHTEPPSMTWVIAENSLRCEDPEDVGAVYSNWNGGESCGS